MILRTTRYEGSTRVRTYFVAMPQGCVAGVSVMAAWWGFGTNQRGQWFNAGPGYRPSRAVRVGSLPRGVPAPDRWICEEALW